MTTYHLVTYGGGLFTLVFAPAILAINYTSSTAYLDHPGEQTLEGGPWPALLGLLPGSAPGWRQTSQVEGLPPTRQVLTRSIAWWCHESRPNWTSWEVEFPEKDAASARLCNTGGMVGQQMKDVFSRAVSMLLLALAWSNSNTAPAS